MITLIAAAAVAAAQPAPMPAHDMSMSPAQHEAMKGKCCCDDMEKAGHDMHAPSRPQDHRGE